MPHLLFDYERKPELPHPPSSLSEIQHILLLIGLYGNKISSLITILALFPNYLYVFSFTIGYFINRFLNKKLKLLFKEDRPNNPITFYPGEENEYKNEEKWGFPSGHAQITSFAFVFLLLFKPKSHIFLYLCAGVVLLSLIQRYIYNRHTVYQLIAGVSIGSLFAALYFIFIRKFIIR